MTSILNVAGMAYVAALLLMHISNEEVHVQHSLVPMPSPLSAHYTRASFAHVDSYAPGRPGLKHHVR